MYVYYCNVLVHMSTCRRGSCSSISHLLVSVAHINIDGYISYNSLIAF